MPTFHVGHATSMRRGKQLVYMMEELKILNNVYIISRFSVIEI